MKSYFLPLKKEYFLKVKTGVQSSEIRPLNHHGWNKKNIFSGRVLNVSCGYGKQDRFLKSVQYSIVTDNLLSSGVSPDHVAAVESIYGQRDSWLVAFFNHTIQHEKLISRLISPLKSSVIHLISMSGGKDSLATRLVAIEKGIPHIAIFADTGNESQVTYDYLDYLREKTGDIITVKADFKKAFDHKKTVINSKWVKDGVSNRIRQSVLNQLEQPTGIPFLDMAIYKGRFPSPFSKFCSYLLKIEPITEYISTLVYDRLWSWQGVRADESKKRSLMPQIEKSDNNVFIVRPILGWSADRVFKIAKRHGIAPNPLYKQGFTRVGCFPCINCRKAEILNIYNRFPDHINRLKSWEKLISLSSKKGQLATFFNAHKIPGSSPTRATIENVVDWSKTSWGGRQYGLFSDQSPACLSPYGLCGH